MTSKELAIKYSVDLNELDSFIMNSNFKFMKTMLGGIKLLDDPDEIYTAFTEFKEAEREHAIENGETDAFNTQDLQSIIISTTPVLPGYTIQKYCGMVSNTLIFTYLPKTVSDTLPSIIKEAEYNLKKEAIKVNANAVIGVSFSVYSFDDDKVANITNLTLCGTAVYIEKQ